MCVEVSVSGHDNEGGGTTVEHVCVEHSLFEYNGCLEDAGRSWSIFLLFYIISTLLIRTFLSRIHWLCWTLFIAPKSENYVNLLFFLVEHRVFISFPFTSVNRISVYKTNVHVCRKSWYKKLLKLWIMSDSLINSIYELQ